MTGIGAARFVAAGLAAWAATGVTPAGAAEGPAAPGSGAAEPDLSRKVDVESAISLGERRSLVIVSVEGRRLLLGLTSTQVSLITELAHLSPHFGPALDAAMAPEKRGARS